MIQIKRKPTSQKVIRILLLHLFSLSLFLTLYFRSTHTVCDLWLVQCEYFEYDEQ